MKPNPHMRRSRRDSKTYKRLRVKGEWEAVALKLKKMPRLFLLEQTGLSPSTLSRYINCRLEPTFSMGKLLEDLTNLPLAS